MLFNVFVVIVALLDLVLLELSKNILVGWLITVILAIAMIVLRKKTDISRGLLWVGFVVCLILNFVLTAPPYKNVPAVANIRIKLTTVSTFLTIYALSSFTKIPPKDFLTQLLYYIIFLMSNFMYI